MIPTIYSIDCPEETLMTILRKLTNQTWKLIPMYENKEDWRYQLSNVILEASGLSYIFFSLPEFVVYLANLEGLRQIDEDNFDFKVYRHIVFESINLIQGLVKRYETK